MKNMDYISFNAGIWDNINECLADKSTAISHEEYIAAKNGTLGRDGRPGSAGAEFQQGCRIK